MEQFCQLLYPFGHFWRFLAIHLRNLGYQVFQKGGGLPGTGCGTDEAVNQKSQCIALCKVGCYIIVVLLLPTLQKGAEGDLQYGISHQR